jgi:CrcB protein
MNLLLVGTGGAIGSICRYLLGGWVYTAMGKPEFPFGTFVVNMIGCLLIGLFNEYAEARQLVAAHFRLLMVVGFLGGFTTFSSFGYETVELIREGEPAYAAINAIAQVVIGVCGCALGIWIGKQIWQAG